MVQAKKIIKIDAEKCSGCGLCVQACHESAIAMADGKAKLVRDDYCDGLGNCLPVCPAGAITFEEREASACNEPTAPLNAAPPDAAPPDAAPPVSRLSQWPVQIQLAPVSAPYFNNANLLVAADCTAFAYGDFHDRFIKNRITLVGCPKLDDANYAAKLTEIIFKNNIKSVTVVRMEVPCCGGIEQAAIAAVKNSGKILPLQVFVISTAGGILNCVS